MTSTTASPADERQMDRLETRASARPFRFGHFPWLTGAVIAVNTLVYAVTASQGALDFDAMVRFGGKVPPLITDLGEYWRLLTGNFLHRDALHLALNMLVLFNVGGVLENAYRRLDFLFLLLASGLATMAVSLLLSDAVSVGASGMVYGCLGALLVFGFNYRELLPSRYRRILGEAAIPTVLMFLWIGWRSSGVDNSAHLGGLACGVALGALLRPTRLVGEAPGWRRGILMGAIAAVLAAGFFAPAQWLAAFRSEYDDRFGISVEVPGGWRPGANHLGQLAYYNGLPGLGRATFAAQAIGVDEPFELADKARQFTHESLKRRVLGPDVTRVQTSKPEPVRIANRAGVRVDALFEEPSGSTRLTAYFVRRGELVYQFVFTHPAAFPRYSEIVERMSRSLRLDEPRHLREARARALLFPGAPWALSALGGALDELGEPAVAVRALRAAVEEQPTSGLFRAQLALALFKAGEVQQACAESAAAVQQSSLNAVALEADARCALARGHTQQALERLRSARRLAPSDDRLRRAEEALSGAMTGAEK